MTRVMIIVMSKWRPIEALYRNGDGNPNVIVNELATHQVIPEKVITDSPCPEESIVSSLHQHLQPVHEGEDFLEGCCGDWNTLFGCKEGYIDDLHRLQSVWIPDFTFYFTSDRFEGSVWVSINYFGLTGERQLFLGKWSDCTQLSLNYFPDLLSRLDDVL